MVVYADILIVLNLIVDYFLLLAAGRLIRTKKGVWRILSGAAVGAVSSMIIFLPQIHIVLEFLLRFVSCVLMALCAYGFHSLKMWLRNSGILFAVSCGWAGIMIAFWYLCRPAGMVINNSVVYFSISPVVLIVSTVAGYFLFTALGLIFAKSNGISEKCNVRVFADENSIEMTAIIDTGNSIEDIFSKSEVIITDEAQVKRLFGETNIESSEALKSRYRVIPCGTVSGGGILQGYRCDRAVIESEKKKIELKKPVLAISKTALRDDYNAIVNPNIFL